MRRFENKLWWICHFIASFFSIIFSDFVVYIISIDFECLNNRYLLQTNADISVVYVCMCVCTRGHDWTPQRLVFKWSERNMMRIKTFLDYLCQNKHDKTKRKYPKSAKKRLPNSISATKKTAKRQNGCIDKRKSSHTIYFQWLAFCCDLFRSFIGFCNCWNRNKPIMIFMPAFIGLLLLLLLSAFSLDVRTLTKQMLSLNLFS